MVKQIFFIYIHKDKCTACGKCFHICPTKCIVGQYNKEFIILVRECINCKKCELVCFEKVIYFDTVLLS